MARTPGRKVAGEIAADAVISLAIVVLLVFAKQWFDDRAPGQWVRSTYAGAALRLARATDVRKPDAAIVNLNAFPTLPQIDCGDGTRFNPLDREALLLAIKAVASDPTKLPYSVGVDADFGSCSGKNVEPAIDPAFFAELLDFERATFPKHQLNQTGPIYLGVFRGTGGDPTAWLANERFKSLAANIGAPIDDAVRIVRFVQRSGSSRRGYGLAERLAYPYGVMDSPDAGFWSVFREPSTLRRGDDSLNLDLAPVDFRGISSIDTPLSTTGSLSEMRNALARAAQNGYFADKIVLFGLVSTDTPKSAGQVYADAHRVPGLSDQPGALIQATAADSLRRSPLYELRGWWRLALDLGGSAAIIVAIALVRWRHANDSRIVHKERLAKILSAVLAMMLLVISFSIFLFGHVMWDDALLLALFVAIHPYFGRWSASFARWVRRGTIKFWNWAAFGGSEADAP